VSQVFLSIESSDYYLIFRPLRGKTLSGFSLGGYKSGHVKIACFLYTVEYDFFEYFLVVGSSSRFSGYVTTQIKKTKPGSFNNYWI